MSTNTWYNNNMTPEMYRLLAMRAALGLEEKGLRHSRVSVKTLARQEMGRPKATRTQLIALLSSKIDDYKEALRNGPMRNT